MAGPNKPWLILARSLGIVASTLGSATNIDITVLSSDLTDTSFLPSAVASGYLCGLSNDPKINLINAPALAKEKGITLTLKKSTVTSAPPKSLEVSIQVASVTFKIVGQSGGESVALLKSIDENEFVGGLPLDGSILFFTGTATQSISGFSAVEAALSKKNIAASAVYRSTAGKDQVAWYSARVTPATTEPIDLSAATGIKFVASRNF